MHSLFHKYLPLLISLVLIVGILFFISFGFINQKTAQASWYATGGTWTYRKPIVIDHTKVSTNDQTDFPVLISVTDSDLDAHALSSGNDILFTSSDGTTKLDYEREKYDSTTGTLVAWVRIPTLSHTVDTTIYIYYGNASASDQQNASGVWNTNYKGVWHFANGSILSASDSTGNGNTGTITGQSGNNMAGTGYIDGGAVFNDSQYIDFGGSVLWNSTVAHTFSAWTDLTGFVSDHYPVIGTFNSELTDGFGIYYSDQSGYTGINVGHNNTELNIKTAGDISSSLTG